MSIIVVLLLLFWLCGTDSKIKKVRKWSPFKLPDYQGDESFYED